MLYYIVPRIRQGWSKTRNYTPSSKKQFNIRISGNARDLSNIKVGRGMYAEFNYYFLVLLVHSRNSQVSKRNHVPHEISDPFTISRILAQNLCQLIYLLEIAGL